MFGVILDSDLLADLRLIRLQDRVLRVLLANKLIVEHLVVGVDAEKSRRILVSTRGHFLVLAENSIDVIRVDLLVSHFQLVVVK